MKTYWLKFTGWDDKHEVHQQYSLCVRVTDDEHTAALGSLNELVESGELRSYSLDEADGCFIVDRVYTLAAAVGFVQSHLPQPGDNNA